MLTRLSARLETVEWYCAGALLGVVFLLLLLNVITRALGAPLLWVDELTIYATIWAAFIGASIAISNRQHVAMTMLTDRLPRKMRDAILWAVDAALLVFFIILGWLIWIWLDPLGLMQAGSVARFSQETFNFVYSEPTVTLGTRKIWFWLILPVFCLTGLVHCAANLSQRLPTEKNAP
ncbi:TRAP transporter small permease [Paracoccus aerodenitrificans]|uniref:TRAP transporter small permease n=1 Tax=Paracoccus aerodenitrificans TaxID=3017781 RepID=UPI0022F060C7|nr:TRAP transporter small permease subunit [Paracoccus aerodenitrificans]WBU63478.1 TRAP transporter small permease subunit [Paracoccus aerodenitrificans]